MLNKKEIIDILIATLIIAFTISLIQTWNIFLTSLLIVFIVIFINILAKKITGYYYETKIDIKLWEIKRWGVKKHQKFKRSFPLGAFLPLISKIILFPFNSFVWMASLVFDIKPHVYRAAKRHGLYSYSEVNESHIGTIAAAGVLTNLVFAVIGYLLGFAYFSKINIYFAFFNMLPISELDGNKIFFGNLLLWAVLACITLIGLGYAFLLI